jgi:predicted glycosyltransferase
MASEYRFFLYCQHLTGTGHFVRTLEIAKALAQFHEVYLIDGGRPVLREALPPKIKLVSLPRIYRNAQGLAPFDSADPLPVVMRSRLQILRAALQQFRPHVVMFEHFPFRRSELHAEIVPLILQARASNPRVKIVGSYRDVLGSSASDPQTAQHRRKVQQVLREQFDHLLVHADPRVIQADDQAALANKAQVPLEYTGYVSQCPSAGRSNANTTRARRRHGDVIVSAGGTGSISLLSCVMESWNSLAAHPAIANRKLLVFLPLSVSNNDAALLQRHAANRSIRLLPFSLDFLQYMHSADLSISNAGYNTCTNVLQACTRSILIPNSQMSDQRLRAQRFAEHGLAATIDPADLTPQRLAHVIVQQLQAPLIQHDFNLRGAEYTRQILEGLCAADAASPAAQRTAAIRVA